MRSSLRWSNNRPGVAIRMSQPARMFLSSESLFVPPMAKQTLYFGRRCSNAVASFAICIANSRVGDMTNKEIPEPGLRFLLMRVWIAGSKKAIVFPVPVFACAKQSLRSARRS